MTTYSLQQLDLLTLFEMRTRYKVLPSCQREFVWKLREQQGFIDTMLRGLPVPPIAYIETAVPLGRTFYELVDGQQRFETIVRYFEDSFATATRFSSEEVKPLYPGLRYSQLPMDARSKLDSYKLPMLTMSDVTDDRTIGLIFRRWQGGQKLTFAEKLYSYDGVTKQIADRVAGHRFWEQMYAGNRIRKHPFQAGIQMLILETMGTFANMTTRSQVDVFQKSSVDWQDVPSRMEQRMNYLMHLYDGSDFRAVGQVVLAYQGAMLLDEAGYSILSCPRGVLTPWYMRIKGSALVDHTNGYGDLFSKITRVVTQREFWGTHWAEVCGLASDGKRDTKRYASIKDKIAMWNAQAGKCDWCGKDLRWQDGVIAHHKTAYAKGGATVIDNMVLMHRLCHEKQHLEQQSEMTSDATE